jgi:hypothetical protein
MCREALAAIASFAARLWIDRERSDVRSAEKGALEFALPIAV